MTNSIVGYAAAVLAIYLVLLLPAAYTAYKHGVKARAWIGWGYFMIFCTLRIVGSALQIANPTSIGAAIISSVGLSPLTISLSGALFEGRYYLLSLHRNADKRKTDHVYLLLLHLTLAAAIALLAAGASSLPTAASAAALTTAWDLAGVGALLLLAALALVFLGAVYTLLCHKPVSQQQCLARRIVVAVAVAAPVLAVRVVGAAVADWGRRVDMNPVTGGLGFKVGLDLVPEVLAAVVLLVGGFAARNVASDGGGGDGECEAGRKISVRSG